MSGTGAGELSAQVIDILNAVTKDWETDFDGGIGRDTALIADLGFESIDMVHLIAAIEQRFDRRDLPFEKLVMEDGRYKSDFAVSDVVAFLEEHL